MQIWSLVTSAYRFYWLFWSFLSHYCTGNYIFCLYKTGATVYFTQIALTIAFIVLTAYDFCFDMHSLKFDAIKVAVSVVLAVLVGANVFFVLGVEILKIFLMLWLDSQGAGEDNLYIAHYMDGMSEQQRQTLRTNPDQDYYRPPNIETIYRARSRSINRQRERDLSRHHEARPFQNPSFYQTRNLDPDPRNRNLQNFSGHYNHLNYNAEEAHIRRNLHSPKPNYSYAQAQPNISQFINRSGQKDSPRPFIKSENPMIDNNTSTLINANMPNRSKRETLENPPNTEIANKVLQEPTRNPVNENKSKKGKTPHK